MSRKFLLLAALLTAKLHAAEGLLLVDPPSPLAPLPVSWGAMGRGPHDLPARCEIGIDDTMAADWPQVFSVRCANQDIPSFGGAFMWIDMTRYQGKRVRISAWLKVAGVERVVNTRFPAAEGGAGLYLALGSPSGGMRVDRMQPRSLKGSTAWELRDIVVDVPKDSRRSMLGFWMEGKGQFWMRDLQVEPVSRKVPVNFKPEAGAGSGITLK